MVNMAKLLINTPICYDEISDLSPVHPACWIAGIVIQLEQNHSWNQNGSRNHERQIESLYKQWLDRLWNPTLKMNFPLVTWVVCMYQSCIFIGSLQDIRVPITPTMEFSFALISQVRIQRGCCNIVYPPKTHLNSWPLGDLNKILDK